MSTSASVSQAWRRNPAAHEPPHEAETSYFPLRGLRVFRLCPSSAVCCWRFVLASLGDARAADAMIFVVIINHAAAYAVQPPVTSSLAAVAMRVLRRCVWLSAQFAFRTWHGTPLRRAVRVCSSTYTLYICAEPVFCLVVCVRARGNRHYWG